MLTLIEMLTHFVYHWQYIITNIKGGSSLFLNLSNLSFCLAEDQPLPLYLYCLLTAENYKSLTYNIF